MTITQAIVHGITEIDFIKVIKLYRATKAARSPAKPAAPAATALRPAELALLVEVLAEDVLEPVAEDAWLVVIEDVDDEVAEPEEDDPVAEPVAETSAAAICADSAAVKVPDMLSSVNLAEKASAGSFPTFVESDEKRIKLEFVRQSSLSRFTNA